MHAYLFIGNNKESLEQKVEKYFGNITQNLNHEVVAKIEDVRNLRKNLKLARGSLSYIKIDDIDQATTEAQNAFLKNLEEPPKNIKFLLTAKSDSSILPTILSRCQIIKTQNLFLYPEVDITSFFKKDICEQILYVGKIQKKDAAVNFITDIIFYIHDTIKKGVQLEIKYLRFLRAAKKTLVNIKSNGNVFLQLLNFSIIIGRHLQQKEV